MNQTANQIKYEWIKAVDFTKDQRNHFCRIVIQKCIKHIKKGKSVIAERLIRALKNEIYKYMTSVSKNVYVDKLNDIVINIITHIIEQLK